MIDIIIIVAYIAVVLKILLKVFQWFQDKFHIYGQVDTHVSTLEQTITQPTEQALTQQKPIIKQTQIKQPTTQKSIQSTKSIKQQKTTSTPVPVPQPIQTKSQQEKPIQPLKQQNQLKVQEQQKIVPEQISAVVIEASNLQISEPQRTFTAPVIEINLPPQDQYTNEALIQQNQELRQLYTKAQKQSEKQFNELNQFIEKLKSDKNKYSEKLIGAVQDYQNQKEKNKRLSQEISEMRNLLADKIEGIKSKYESQISQLKQKLIEQQQTITKGQTTQQNVQSSEQVLGLKSRLEEMKNQLEFSQSQLQQSYQSQSKMKEQIEKLKAQSQARHQEIQKLRAEGLSKLKTRPQISISDVINHPEYVRIKERLQRYESGTMGGSGIRSVIQRTEYTPQGERLSKGLDSRVSERRSFVSTRYNAESSISGEQEVFSQCNFLSPENKHFLLDEIKKIKKLPIKKTKLLFKLDKLHPTNPHENIDNIPNIVLLVELTNKKILAAFTQTAFNKEDSSIIGDKSMISRSRYGANKSLIVDLTSKVTLPNTKSTETIIYDENAIVWGKDQLIIKNDEPTILYSSFGTEEGTYWDGKYTLEELLGGSQGFERISQYEFYRIYIG